jgi:hypothetical protein
METYESRHKVITDSVLPRIATVTGLSALYESAEPAILANAAHAASQINYSDSDMDSDEDYFSTDTALTTPVKRRNLI